MQLVADVKKMISGRRLQLLSLAVIVLAGTVAYSNTLQIPFVLDDYNSINMYGTREFSEILLHGSARRFADLTFALNYRLHGLQLPGYHLVNLLIHLAAALTLYFVILSAISALKHSFAPVQTNSEPPVKQTAEFRFIEQFLPLAAALLFVTHPIQTQAITYIIQRYTSLATLLYLTSVLLFLKARLTFEKSGGYRYSLLLGCGSLLAGILAIGSKQIAATLPLMLLLLEIFIFKGRLINRRFYIACGTFFLLFVIAVTLQWHDRSLHEIVIALNKATSEDETTTRTTYFLTQTRVVVNYLRLLLLPYGQCLMPDSPRYTMLFCVPVLVSLTLHLCLITTAAVLFKISHNNFRSQDMARGILQRLAAVGIIWFYTAMLVESSVFPITDVMFEHRIYLPSVGFFMTITSAAAFAVHANRTGIKLMWSLLLVVCIILGGLTIARNRVWNDTLTLWQDTVNKSPNKALALANLAEAYFFRNMPDKSLPLLVRAIELKGDFQKFHLGEVLQELNVYAGRFTTGKEYIRPGTFLGSGTPNDDSRNLYESAISNTLALAYEYMGTPHKAKNAYTASLLLNPANDLAWYNMGLLSLRLGDYEQARKALLQLRSRNPSLAGLLEPAMAQK